jgi:hypothetical protein
MFVLRSFQICEWNYKIFQVNKNDRQKQKHARASTAADFLILHDWARILKRKPIKTEGGLGLTDIAINEEYACPPGLV